MTLTIKNRELLRKYKFLKDKLISGEVNEIIIPQKENIVLKITIQKADTHFDALLKKIQKRPLKNISRPKEDII